MIEILYDDEHGTDLLIGGRHNVNIGWEHDSLASVTHTSRDGKPMEVRFHETFRTYFVMVGE